VARPAPEQSGVVTVHAPDGGPALWFSKPSQIAVGRHVSGGGVDSPGVGGGVDGGGVDGGGALAGQGTLLWAKALGAG
jgi:hypothetical protein